MFLNKEMRWPLYEIGVHRKIWEEDNIIYIETLFNKTYTIDNKNLYGDTLGKRRIRLNKEDRYKLKKICYTLYEVFNAKGKTFIDSNGIFYTFKKKKRASLVYRQVELITTRADGSLLCKCVGIFRPITVPFLPRHMPKYLGLLVVERDYYLYDLSDSKKKDTWRLI